mgnify:CR=1 FL=1
MASNYPADYSSPQSGQNAKPNTVASAATLTPQHKFTRVTGTTEVTTITPPDPAGYCELTFIWTTGTANGFNTGVSTQGGIAIAYTTVTNRPVTLYYDPRTGLWYPMAVS